MTGTLETAAADLQEQARQTFRQSQAEEMPLTGKALGEMFDRSDRWGRDRIAEVRGPASAPPPFVGWGAATKPEALPEAMPEVERRPETGERQPVAPVAAAAAPERQPDITERQPQRQPETSAVTVKTRPKASTWLFLLGAIVGLGVSINTSWRYFDQKMGIHDVVERVSMFAGMEIVLIACGVAMFEAARDPKAKAGPAKVLAWALCAVSAFAAMQLSGGLVGPMRVILGPVLAVIGLHLALGIELRAGKHERTGALAKAGREIRERLLSRLGLADDERDAAARTRDRKARKLARTKASAARRAAHIARAPGLVLFRQRRLTRAIKTADVTHDETQRQRLLAEIQTIEHAEKLRTLQQPSPWQAAIAAAAAETATAAGGER